MITPMEAELPLLQVRGIGKLYARKQSDTRRRMGRVARKALFNMGRPEIKDVKGTEFWAVRDVSFDLQRGKAVGIIGLNGSGKTTLLRMLAGQILPDAGDVTIRGTSATMIDLQAGFKANASGRENIFLRAAALGFRRSETETRLSDIIGFSELDHAIDAPLSTYSSGMKMRLAFSVMAMVSPELLLIDEVLAVGDFRFRQKSLARMREMRSNSAFVFVSHSMGDVAKFCDRVIVMHKGCVFFEGDPAEAIEVYETLDQGVVSADVPQQLEKAMGPTFENNCVIENVTHYWCNADGDTVESVRFDEKLRLRIKFKSLIDIRNLIVGIPVWAVTSQYVTGLSTQITSDKFSVKAGDEVDLVVEVEAGFVNPGVMKSILAIVDGPEFLFRRSNPDLVILAAKHPTWGVVTVPHKWTRLDLEEHSPSVTGLVPGR